MLRLAALLCALSLGCGVTYSASYSNPDVSDAAPDALWVDDSPEDPRPDCVVPFEDLPEASSPVDSSDPPPVGRGAPYPVVLVHGFAGFQNIGPLNYFFNVARDLREGGSAVYETELPPFLPPAERAAALSLHVDRALRETGSARVILIAHSQGGLDARYLVASLRYGDRVAAVVTVSTPHRGTRLADLFLGLAPGPSDALLNAVAALFGMVYNDARSRADLRATLNAMSESAIERFNAANPNDPRVLYWSYAGRSGRRDGSARCAGSVIPNDPGRTDFPFAPLSLAVSYLEQGDPSAHVNDGLVEVQSARWGTFMGCVPADHFDEVGQPARLFPDILSGFDHRAFYLDIVRRLRREGL